MLFKLLSSQYPGMRWWLSQRLTALLMAIYIVLLIVALMVIQPVGYVAWHNFAHGMAFRIGTYLFFICLSIHAWLGVRDVLRDYVFNRSLRAYMQVAVDCLIVIELIWLLVILWKV